MKLQVEVYDGDNEYSAQRRITFVPGGQTAGLEVHEGDGVWREVNVAGHASWAFIEPTYQQLREFASKMFHPMSADSWRES